MKKPEDYIEQIVREEIRELKAYAVADATGMVKLDAMENPYGLPPQLKQEWLGFIEKAELNRYPSASADGVKQALKKVMQAADDLDVVLGNGSDELIQMIIAACCDDQRGVLTVQPSFVMYQMIAKFLRTPFRAVDLASDFSLDEETLLQADKDMQPGVIFLAQPNNPTGNLFDPAVIARLAEQTSALVVIDEAYLPFTDNDSLAFLQTHPNVVVMRTLSKVGFAGLRLGFLFAKPQWAIEFDKVRLPYNIGQLTQLSAEFLLSRYEVFAEQADELRGLRASLSSSLADMPMFDTVFTSETNFILARLKQAGSAAKVIEGLKQRKVLIKSMDGGHPLLADCLRFTVGTEDENNQLIAALQQLA